MHGYPVMQVVQYSVPPPCNYLEPYRPPSTGTKCFIVLPHTSGVRKYVIWCLICGGTSLVLGLLFLAVYFLIRSYTSTVSYFETVPSFVPATLLKDAPAPTLCAKGQKATKLCDNKK
uniref:CSON015217 protein n=1 Tax=Culicoides sonorensis TaxID=179676 RepID=A0A336KW53_CULSO